MIEHWNIYTERRYTAAPWPWKHRQWETLTAGDLKELPFAVDDFGRYSPADGPADMTHVPWEMPQERPSAPTRLAVYHDAEHLYVLIEAVKPTHPIPELADVAREDFSCVVQWGRLARGLYFGLNDQGEHIGTVQLWTGEPQADPTSARLTKEYAARLVRRPDALTALWRIDRSVLESGISGGCLRLSAGRRCYATGELVCWGSPIIWSPRFDRMGVVELVETRSSPAEPRARRIDLVYDPETERGEFVVAFDGPVEGPPLQVLLKGHYAEHLGRIVLALNGQEQMMPLRRQVRAAFPIADGWNRLECLTGFGPSEVVHFQKFSGQRIVVRRPAAKSLPSLDELDAAFRQWHAAHEKHYVAPGTWGPRGDRVHCLCHRGAFQVEPYLYAWQHLPRDPVYETRIRETGERMLARQQEAGWFPCDCFSETVLGREAQLGDGGAFANGSVGETLALAATLLGEKTYLQSSIRAADYSWYRWEPNQNYAAFVLWHLAALQERDPRAEWIRKAQYYARHFVTAGIDPSGAQDGHNYYTAYGNITLKGLARSLSVLPPGHEFYRPLKDKLLRYTNQVLSRQQPSGLFAGRNRKYLGYHHVVPGLFFVAEALPDLAGDLKPALTTMYRAASAGDASPETGLTIARMARYLRLLERSSG